MKIAELGGGLDKCLKSYEHNKLVEELIDNSTGQTIGLIYNLLYNNLFNNNNNFNNNVNKNLSNYNNNIIKSIYPIILSICKINKLANYFSGNHEFSNNNKQSLTNLLKKISEKNNNNNENPIKSYKAEINEVINKLYPRLNDKNKIVESKEFILFAISQLHKELNKASNVNINMINNNQDQTNQLAMFKIFAEKFQKENRSIISDLFYGTFHIEIKCARCGIIKHNFEIFSNLIFDLEAVKQNKIDVMMNLMNFNQPINNQQIQLNLECFKNLNSVNIYDCFDYSQKIYTLQDDDAIPCNYCGNGNKSYHQTIIYTPPEILILILDRSQQTNIKLEFIEDLNLSNYIKFNDVGKMFKLISIIKEENGNFITCCKNLNEQQWYRYEENTISKITNFKSQIVDSGLVHILFYQKYA